MLPKSDTIRFQNAGCSWYVNFILEGVLRFYFLIKKKSAVISINVIQLEFELECTHRKREGGGRRGREGGREGNREVGREAGQSVLF